MTLYDYLYDEHISQEEFAIEMDVSITHIIMIISMKARCSPKLAKKIEARTDGKVSRLELLYPEEHFNELRRVRRRPLFRRP